MIRLTGPCTIKLPADCVLHIEPRQDKSAYLLQIVREDDGVIVFNTYFGIDQLTPTKDGDFSLDRV